MDQIFLCTQPNPHFNNTPLIDINSNDLQSDIVKVVYDDETEFSEF